MVMVKRRLLQTGYDQVLTPTFPYHRVSLEELALELSATIHQLCVKKKIQQIDVVTYSMGGLLLRALLHHSPPLRRVVMLSPPNQGAEMAEIVRRFIPLHQMGWDPLSPLLPESPAILPQPSAELELAIITGSKGDGRGYNPLLSSDNDGKVRVEESYLDHPFPHKIMRCRHPMMILHSTPLSLKSGVLA